MMSRLEEYKILEKRMQNDSQVGYLLMTALLAIFPVAYTLSLNYIFKALSDHHYSASLSIASLAGFVSMLSLLLGMCVQLRFRDTGEIRRARAIQIERALGYSSFRLFKDTSEIEEQDDVSNFFLELGGIVNNKRRNSDRASDPESGELIKIGKSFHNKVVIGQMRITEQFAWFIIIIDLIWLIPIWIVILFYGNNSLHFVGMLYFIIAHIPFALTLGIADENGLLILRKSNDESSRTANEENLMKDPE